MEQRVRSIGMNEKKRALLLCIISVIGGMAWFIADLTEYGLSMRILGGPVLALGIVGIPSLVQYVKYGKK
jgi:uncharacterized membrane protein YuzA (DUF378 family)